MSILNPRYELLQAKTRRHFLRDSSAGIGAIALSSLLREDTLGITDPTAPQASHFEAKAKRVIYLHGMGCGQIRRRE